MATCKDCIHYDICIFHLKGNENEECVHFRNTADVVSREELEGYKHNWQKIAESYTSACVDHYKKGRSEVAREIFEEIEDVLNHIGYFDELDFNTLKKKYTEEKEK